MSDPQPAHLSDHLANERTFLAWIRTAIGIMAFGFVVVKFSLFVKQLSFVLNTQPLPVQGKGYSAVAGIGLVVMGALLTVFAFARYKRTEKSINQQDFRQKSWLLTVLTVCIALMGLFLIVYLIGNV
jgi:putative membrane protein